MNQKIYNETLQACLHGGMTDDAAHEYATDKATRTGTQHTPGPWVTLDRYTNRQAVPIGRKHDSMTHDVFAEAHGHNFEANARLIAAAPDLLAALEAMAAALTQPVQFTGIRNGASCDVLRFDAALAVKVARAAIAKATGETL